jgi:ADP-ribosylarginine hydrolase
MNEKIEASLMLSSYFETLGFKNGEWEFNYTIIPNDLHEYTSMWNILNHNFLILGGPMNISLNNWNASDDTIMIIATGNAIVKGDYEKEYLDIYDLLYSQKRGSGKCTLTSLEKLKRNQPLDINSSMGGNGAAMRTGPIGLYYYNDIEKVIQESIKASIITHNYYLGFLGGMVTAVFTAFAMKNIPAWKWCEELITLYNKKIIHKYYPEKHNINDLNEYIGYWKRYQETRINKLKYKNTLDNCKFPEDRTTFLLSFYPNSKIKDLTLRGEKLNKLKFNWNHIASTGLDVCIYAYDCLLMSMITPNSNNLDLNNFIYSFDTFMTLVCIHPGDNDTTGAIGGTWFGALNGYGDFNRVRIKELEFYSELLDVSKKLKKLKS